MKVRFGMPWAVGDGFAHGFLRFLSEIDLALTQNLPQTATQIMAQEKMARHGIVETADAEDLERLGAPIFVSLDGPSTASFPGRARNSLARAQRRKKRCGDRGATLFLDSTCGSPASLQLCATDYFQ